MRKPCLKPRRRKQQHSEKHIRQVAHSRIGQCSFKMSLFHRLRSRVQQGKGCRIDADELRVTPFHLFRGENVPCHTHHRKHTGIHDSNRMQQCCHRRRGCRGRRQPFLKRKYSGLHAEAEESEDKCSLHKSTCTVLYKASAVDEVAAVPVYRRKNNRKEGKRRAADRVSRIFPACV